jgi:hypothetical protein
VSDWQLTHEEAGQSCYMKNIRGFIGKLQLRAEPEMELKVYADCWDVDYLFVLFVVAFTVGPTLGVAVYFIRNGCPNDTVTN